MFQHEILPESPQLPKMWELTGISIPPCRSYSCLLLVALSSGHSHDFVLHYIWVKTSWVLNLVFCLSVTRSFSKLPSGWAPVCQVSSDRSRHQGGRGGRVFLPWNRASWFPAGYSNPTRSQPNIIQSLRPHLKMFHHHSESKQGLAEPREGKWRKVELWTPSGFSCWCFCIITMVSEVGCQDESSLHVVLPASFSLLCGHTGRRASPETTNTAA